MLRLLAACLLLASALGAAQSAPATPDTAGQSGTASNSSTSPIFVAVHVERSPSMSFNNMRGGGVYGNRYEVFDATIGQLIAGAYDYNSKFIAGGPVWAGMRRYDVLAAVPPGTTPATLKLMLRAMLADRFALKVHEGTAMKSTYFIKLAGDKPRLKESDGSGDGSCDYQQPPGASSEVPLNYYKCGNVTLAVFARFLQGMRGAGYIPVTDPVVDATGLTGTYDFELHWTPQGAMAEAGPDGITLSDAMEKQLGLKLVLDKAPHAALIIDHVDETPTPDPPGTDKLLPAPIPLEFEVATVKPARPDERSGGGIHGLEIDVQAFTLRQLMNLAWDLNPRDKEALVNAPDWLDKDRFDISAKISFPGQGDASDNGFTRAPYVDITEIMKMIQALILQRFQMKIHTEDRPVTTYTLVADHPKIKPTADPTGPMRCTDGPGPDGQDPRRLNPILNKLYYCENMTMAVFAEQIGKQFMARDYIYYPVLDQTGLKGSYDFTLSYSSMSNLTLNPGGGSEPNGAVTLFDAVKNQMGLRLEKTKRPEPVLVIDHVERTPIEN
jgi:uncharacterized protein (TIGR03435 family)